MTATRRCLLLSHTDQSYGSVLWCGLSDADGVIERLISRDFSLLSE